MPAPKGNKFALGNSGKDKHWSSPEELQKDIDAYFYECDNNIVGYDKHNHPITEPYLIEGLALALDCSDTTLRNYEKRPGYEEFFRTVKKAKLKIQKQKLIRGHTGQSNATITIFDLKNNHGYVDEQKHTNKIVMEERTEEEIKDELSRIKKGTGT